MRKFLMRNCYSCGYFRKESDGRNYCNDKDCTVDPNEPVLDQEEFTPEMIDELYRLVVQQQQDVQAEELEENTAELTDYLDRCIGDYDKYMTNSAIITALIR